MSSNQSAEQQCRSDRRGQHGGEPVASAGKRFTFAAARGKGFGNRGDERPSVGQGVIVREGLWGRSPVTSTSAMREFVVAWPGMTRFGEPIDDAPQQVI